jgi:hypothetical protein
LIQAALKRQTKTPVPCAQGRRSHLRLLDSSRRAVRRVGCPFEAIERTVSTRLNADETATALAERCAALLDLGLDHAVVVTPGPWTEVRVEALAAAGEQLR